jgi:hypothetical protein
MSKLDLEAIRARIVSYMRSRDYDLYDDLGADDMLALVNEVESLRGGLEEALDWWESTLTASQPQECEPKRIEELRKLVDS